MVRPYTVEQPFRFWCQKILPLVYDDSLSYYEMLCRVVDYLNNVINNVNSVGEAFNNLQDSITTEVNEFETNITEQFENLQSAFDELSEMVTTYFDNLDVQQEIDNKLDEMAENGTLDALLIPVVTPIIDGVVSDWLEENVTPTGSAVLVDTSLTISGAAADAKVAGDKISGLKGDINILKQFHMSELTPAMIKQIVENGNAAEWFPVGYQIAEDWYKDAATKYVSIWDVVNHFANGDMALNWHYSIPDGVQFDAPEAIYYFEGNEAAGTYHIAVGSAYGSGWAVGQNIQFTLTAAPSAGDQLFIDFGTNYANDPTAGRAWRVYAAGGTTVKQSGTTSSGTGGTSLGTIGNVNAHRPNGRINAISRVVYGYGRWSQSAIRQYLNSAGAAGTWWEMKNPWDRPPSQLASLRGFLAGYSEEFLDIIEAVDVVTALNTQEGFSETTETTQDKIFLPSLQEWHITPQLSNAEGEDWQYMIDLAEEDGRTGRFPINTAIDILKRYNIASQSSSVYVWCRSANRYDAGYALLVSDRGAVYSSYAYGASGGCPACIIKATA